MVSVHYRVMCINVARYSLITPPQCAAIWLLVNWAWTYLPS